MRTIIDLPDDQLTTLAAYCAREGVSRAEAIRRAVAAYIRQQRPEAGADAFGLWRKRKKDGVAYQRRLRREW